ncbi:hypothetical protein [Yersinia aleksiciae]|uniref:Uncharacterized protein n=1 Tax=Yersinia aleksiciae TaxID=263819 RepID=A0ABM5U983_YERAE|nr:hypothetical protein [Yersinia aleksiciae]AKP32133.1 hypothetical protein ACZ76_00470 [Yersinia aleksiciae]CFQ34277.1 Uncharacterised protein [Yersinia aleksiciae]
MKNILSIIFIVFVIFTSNVFAGEWYEGGDLHDANALIWQNADQNNKIATCSDFLVSFLSKGLLKADIKKNIRSIDDLKPYAVELVNQLDLAFERDPNPAKNKIMFANQEISSSAVMLMMMMGWVEQ